MFRSRMSLSVASLVATMLFAVSVARSQSVDNLSFDRKLELARAGNQDAQIAVALAYESGTDVKPNGAEAADWYRKAADQGNLEATFRLARVFSRGAVGVNKDPEGAAKLYETAAQRGHVEAQNWLGYCYQHGIGIQQSDAGAIEWYSKAANAGLAAAQSNLGLMYVTGKGVATDARRAFAQFDQAAKQGDGWGLNNLAGLYEMGWGVSRDEQIALAYYKRAADMGNKTAGQNLQRLTAAIEGAGAATKGDFRPVSPIANAQAAVEGQSAGPKKTTIQDRPAGKKQAKPLGGQRSKNTYKNRQGPNAACHRSFLERLFLGRHCD